MATDLTSLYQQRNAIDLQIQQAREAAARAGEVIVIDGKEYDATIDFEGMLPDPVDTDFFPTYRKDDNGDITDAGEISYADLMSNFGAEAEAIKEEAIEAGTQAKSDIATAKTEALEAIDAAKTTATEAVEEAVTAAESSLDSYANNLKTTQLQPLVDEAQEAATQAGSYRDGAEDAYNATIGLKEDAMIAIGEDNESGARGNAIEAIEEAKTDALAQLDGKIKGGYRVVIGDGTTTDFTINHNLGGEWHLAWAWSEDPAELPYHKIQELDSNSLKVSFYEPPAADSVEIRVISAERVEIADIPDNIEIGPENLSSDCFMTAEEITAIIGG